MRLSPSNREHGQLALMVVASVFFSCAGVAAADSSPARVMLERPEITASADGSDVLIDAPALRRSLELSPQIIIKNVSLAGATSVDLEVERFAVTRRDTRFVLGSRAGDDADFAFDTERVLLLRGRVVGDPGSHVFLALSEWGGTGMIELEGGQRRYVVSPYATGGSTSDPVRLQISGAAQPGGLWPGVPICGVEGQADEAEKRFAAGAVAGLPEITQQIELAIETDYEYRLRFGDLDSAAAYVVILYAAVSDIYLRDVNARLDLSFVRLWDTPDDFFNEPDPLVPFRIYWNDKMTSVHRDVAQFLSGRRDLPYGGIAYLSALCGGAGYSVAGYTLGFYSDPNEPGVNQYDIFVTAHEIGHNSGTSHTHAYGVDNCDDLQGPAQRGTIMSYCSQTISGGNANTDLRFHATVQQFMRNHIFSVGCVVDDCNGNGVDDSIDIAFAASLDLNGNGIADECEDCNANGMLDDLEIADGLADDANGNGVPDGCEPDCNNNNMPDDLDIAGGTSTDLYGNNVPDSCEEDCDESGVSDYTEIQADMALDIDRNALLDACQDCDGDGVNDFEALEGAHNVWVASFAKGGPVNEFHAVSGVRVKTSQLGLVDGAHDLVITPTRRILVSSANDDRIVEFARDGTYVGDFVTAGSGGLANPTGMAVAPGGNLLVCSRDTDSVLEYDGGTGSFVRALVTSGSGGLIQPSSMTFGPNGNLFVASRDLRVIEYNGTSGALVGDFVNAEQGSTLASARGMVFKPDGNLLATSYFGDEVLEFNGADGTLLGKFNHGGTEVALTLDRPWGLRIGPDGHVHVSRSSIDGGGGGAGNHHDDDDSDVGRLHINSTRIYVFDIRSGNFIRSYVMGNDTDLVAPTGFDFMPGSQTDCNFNQLPDSCDITTGASVDFNGNGTPDECECPADLQPDGLVRVPDLIVLLGAWGPCPLPCAPGNALTTCPSDLTDDCSVNVPDLIILLSAWGSCP